ncbi:uncharacterized protein LOC112351473 [Selaginella moellendorffii]|uniref:uncharacterized protein LOC112347207 n=1 Tax=Selaginella moellendorffii TaxID=88036 RepID=UPI000D1C3A35|nr:uncharacterized protein LOC112347207 [Selaginella moellendorffii]XP_024545222.1 uncharacterized protein LOC112351473 [Selaginella moellendorffii]|eukprot:XP_024533467.1 uncharacterized protein LOC112347207 [Selaginella moellendorffii]
MDKIFGPAYRGDPGVPHSGKENFENIFMASVGFTVYTWFFPYYWEQSHFLYNFHDIAMCAEHHQWRKAMQKGERYEFKWNKFMKPKERRSYYYRWRDYYP